MEREWSSRSDVLSGPSLARAAADLFARMPKAELHLHLDGYRVDADEREGAELGEHGAPAAWIGPGVETPGYFR